MINKQSLWVLALGIGLLGGCQSGQQNVQPGQQPEMQIEPFVEVTYEICEKGQKDGCKESSISQFPPVKDIAIKQVNLDSNSAPKSMLFIKSRGCAGTYFTPQKEGYYLLQKEFSGSPDNYTVRIVNQKKIKKKDRWLKIKLESEGQKFFSFISDDRFCKTLSDLNP